MVEDQALLMNARVVLNLGCGRAVLNSGVNAPRDIPPRTLKCSPEDLRLYAFNVQIVQFSPELYNIPLQEIHPVEKCPNFNTGKRYAEEA